MLEHLTAFLENIVANIEAFNQRVQKSFAAFRDGCFARLKAMLHWMSALARRATAYVCRLSKDLAHLALALGKLILFYLPCAILWMLTWYTAAFSWFIVITAAGFISRKQERTSAREPEQIERASPV